MKKFLIVLLLLTVPGSSFGSQVTQLEIDTVKGLVLLNLTSKKTNRLIESFGYTPFTQTAAKNLVEAIGTLIKVDIERAKDRKLWKDGSIVFKVADCISTGFVATVKFYETKLSKEKMDRAITNKTKDLLRSEGWKEKEISFCTEVRENN